MREHTNEVLQLVQVLSPWTLLDLPWSSRSHVLTVASSYLLVFARRSDTGVVNVYDINAALSSTSPSPLKAIMVCAHKRRLFSRAGLSASHGYPLLALDEICQL